MPINTDLNISPYFDDFDDTKNYHRILFRPSTAVQARELTQLQTILQNQIEKFGNWAFKNGDIVDGCAITPLSNVPYIRLQDFQSNSSNFNPALLVNTQVVSTTTGLTARVIYANTGLAANYPNTNIVYLDYHNTGTDGSTNFSNNEQLTFYKIPRTGNNTADTIAVVNTYLNTAANTFTSGSAYGITVSDGVVYLNGNFVTVVNPTFGLVNTYGTYAANMVSGFIATETIITENQDSTILDNALGYPNENAPGAHRLQISPTIISLTPEEASNTDNFNPIAVFNYGSLVQTSKSGANLYSVVNEVISQRTYEESGNYVVNPFVVDSITNAQTNNSVGSNSAFIINANTVLGRINPGIGYAQGSRVAIEKTQYINMRRGIDTQVNAEQQITFNYGGYFNLREVAGSFPFDQAQRVLLYDTPQQAVTTRKFSSLTPSGNNIGTAMTRCFSYISGAQGSNNSNYALHVFNIQMSNGFNVGQIKSVYYNGSPKGVADVTSVGTVNPNAKEQLFTFGAYGLKTLFDTGGVSTSDYSYRYKYSGTLSSATGTVAVSAPTPLPGANNETLPFGLGELPELDAATINLVVTSNGDSVSLGTVTCYSTNSYVIGVAANSFLTKFSAGDQIKVGTDIRTVMSVVNSTAMIVDTAFSANNTSQAHYKTYVAGKILPISRSNVSGSYINVDSTATFTIYTGQIPSSDLNVDVVFDVMRNNSRPATKIINKNRFVKIDTTVLSNTTALSGTVSVNTTTVAVVGTGTSFVNNFSVGDQIIVNSNTRSITSITNSTYLTVNAVFTGTNATANYSRSLTSSKRGPWCLGFSDVHRLRAVYGSSNGTYTTSGANLTRNFVFDTGQRDTHYDLGYLYTKPGYDVSSNPYLLVQLDYFSTSTSNGVGFYTVDSYPIDDANTANTTAIQTKDIPLYVTESGMYIPLRDYVDFRPPCNITANNTGAVDTANATQVTTAISYATVNPSSTLSLSVGSGLNPPSYGSNFESDITFYLPRRDIIYITPDNKIKVKEGLSNLKAQTPLYPDNSMTVSVINVPPYPSLSTDQVDEFLSINQSSINVIRDTRLSISSNLVTNRRYTMRDIGKLDQRITNLEYYASLSLIEKKAADMTVTDANGLNRYKNGIFVEPFNDYSLCDPTNPEHRMAIDPKRGIGRPKINREVINIEFNSSASSNTVKTGRLVTLPYTEKEFLVQPYATKYRSAALVAFAWNGSIRLIPAYDNHQDQHNTGSINITIDATKAWKQFAESPMNQVWGDWQTNTTYVATSVVSGTSTTLDLGFLGVFGGGDWAGARNTALNIIHNRYGQNVTIGKLVLTYMGVGTQEFTF